jgi:hypothetical protein
MGSHGSEKTPKIAAVKAGFVRNDAARNELGGNACRRQPARIIPKEQIMRNNIIAVAAIMGAISTPIAAQAQSDATVGVAPTTGTVISTPVEVDADGGIAVAQRPAFREYIIRERVPTYTIPERVIVGGVLPDDGVTTYDVPQTFGVTPYRYTVVNGRTVLVEPRTRRIVQVID